MIHPEKLVQAFLMGSKQSQSGQRRLELLSKIDSLGSLASAAKVCGMSYKGAWQAVEAMNQLAEEPLVLTQKGGSGGGGMVLTKAGKSLISAYLLFNEQMQHWMRELVDSSPEMMGQLDLMRRIAMKTSARNMFHGSVTHIEKDDVNCEVILRTPQGLDIVAQITPASLERLDLDIGSDVYALIKASWVILSENSGNPLKVSARNQFCGEVVRIDQGKVNSEVMIQLEGGQQLSAIVTHKSVDVLGLVEGEHCCALIKASHVLLAVSD